MICQSSFNNSAFATVIRQRRANYSLRDTAKAIGISHSTLNRAEKQKNIRMDEVLKICDWMQMSIELFITRKFNFDT